MELSEFIYRVDGFDSKTHPEKISLFAWYLHVHKQRDRFEQKDVRACYRAIHLEAPDLSVYFSRLVKRKPPELIKERQGYRLAGPSRRQLDAKYGDHDTVVVVRHMLASLPGTISNEAERTFLSEALTCYRHGAFRAAIVMTWNLAYDHLLNWILADPQRLTVFNAHIIGRVGVKKGAGLAMGKREDFEELKEAQVIDICGTADVFSSHNIKRILEEQRNRRNMAAHPSLIVIGQAQADDSITTLVQNVVLKLI